MNRDVLLLLARIGLGTVFLYSGLDKLAHWSGAVGEAAALGLPLPAVAMAATILAVSYTHLTLPTKRIV